MRREMPIRGDPRDRLDGGILLRSKSHPLRSAIGCILTASSRQVIENMKHIDRLLGDRAATVQRYEFDVVVEL